MKSQEAIAIIVNQAGSQSELARMTNKSRQLISLWVKGKAKVPLNLVKKLSVLSNGKVMPKDLRPDIYNQMF